MRRTTVLLLSLAVAVLAIGFLSMHFSVVDAGADGYETATILPHESVPGLEGAGIVVGRVVDRNGAGIASARIRVLEHFVSERDIGHVSREWEHPSESYVQSDGSGSFTFLWLLPGRYRVCATTEQTLPRISAVFEVAAGKRTLLPDLELLQLRPRDLIQGHVVHESGEPAGGATVIYDVEKQGLWTYRRQNGVVFAKADGSFRVLVPIDAPHSLHAYDISGRKSDTIATVLPGATSVRIVLP